MSLIARLRCLLRGHPDWVETTIVVPEGSLGSQYIVRNAPIPVEIEASIFHGRAFRCVRCNAGRVTDPEGRRTRYAL